MNHTHYEHLKHTRREVRCCPEKRRLKRCRNYEQCLVRDTRAHGAWTHHGYCIGVLDTQTDRHSQIHTDRQTDRQIIQRNTHRRRQIQTYIMAHVPDFDHRHCIGVLAQIDRQTHKDTLHSCTSYILTTDLNIYNLHAKPPVHVVSIT